MTNVHLLGYCAFGGFKDLLFRVYNASRSLPTHSLLTHLKQVLPAARVSAEFGAVLEFDLPHFFHFDHGGTDGKRKSPTPTRKTFKIRPILLYFLRKGSCNGTSARLELALRQLCEGVYNAVTRS
jgi:hypothetical protein